MIFVTGATGYTGRFVVDALLKERADVHCLVRPSSDATAFGRRGVSLIAGDLDRPSEWSGVLSGAEAVISVAHIKYAPGVIAACLAAGVSRAVFFSSTWRFSKVKTPEVAAVTAGEEAVCASGLDYTLLRPTMIYGPGDDRNISRLFAFLCRRPVMPIFGGGENLVQPVYVADVAQAAVGALWRAGAVGKAYELGGAAPMTYNEMVDTLTRLARRVVVKVHIPLFAAILLARIGERVMPGFPMRSDQVRRMNEDRAFDISEAVRELGFTPRTFEEGVREAMRINGAGA